MKKTLIPLILAWSMSLHAARATNTWFCDANAPATLAADTGQAGDAGARAAWRDTEIKPTDPTQVLGAQDELGVIKRQTAPDLQAHALFSFTNLFGSGEGQVGAGTTINEAKLWLYVVQNVCTQTITIAGLAAADAEWDESGACYDYITGTTAWSGGTFSQSVAKTFGTFENPTGTGWFAVDITDALREYQTNGIGGIALLSDSEASGEICNFYFASDEYAETNRAPGLWVSHGTSYSTSTNIGPSGGGNSITITGQTFGSGSDITNATVCGVAATITGQGVNWVTITLGVGPSGGDTGDIVIQSASVGDTTLTDAYTYNPAGGIKNNISGSWTEVRGLPAQLERHAVATLNGRLYAIGGYYSSARTNVYAFDGTNWIQVAGLPAARESHACATWNGALYAVGGNDASTYRTNVYRFDGTNWTEVAGIPQALNQLGCATHGDRLYAVGGYGSGGTKTNAYCFDGTNWTEVAGLPAPRYGFGCVSQDSYIYVLGGQDSNSKSNVYRFNGSEWTEVAGIPHSDTYFGCAELNGSIYVVHGYSWGGVDWVTNAWRRDALGWHSIPGLSYPYIMYGVCGTLNGYLYNVGGDMHETNVFRFYEGEIGVAPVTGTWTGGFQVAIYGSNLCNGADATNVTLCGVSVASILSQSATQILVTAAATVTPGTGDVRVFSASYGVTVKSNAFAYIRQEWQMLGTNSAVVVNDETPSSSKGTLFRSPQAGTSLTNRFRINNTGTDLLRISGYVTNGTGAAAYTVTSVPATIAAGSYSYFYVRFAPGAVSSYEAELEFVNDSTNTPFVLNLSGAGAAVSSNIGPLAGGNTITITNGAAMGNGSDITNVLVGGVAATIVDQGETWVTFILPAASSPGVKDILIQSASVGGSSMPAAYTYNPAGLIGDNGRWTEVRGLSMGRYYHASAVFNDQLYVVGGYYNGTRTNVHRFDGATWTEVAGLPQARQQHGCAVLNGALYAIGGYSSYTNVYRFDGSAWTEVRGLPQVRYDFGCGVLSGALYVVGGYYTGSRTNVYRFDGTNWSEVAGLPATRYALSCVTLDDGLYAIGGYSTYTNVYRFDGSTWTQVRGLPAGRSSFGACAVSGRVHVVAGYSSTTNHYRFDGTNWTELAGLPSSTYYLSGEAFNGHAYAIAGYYQRTNVLYFTEPSTGVNPGGGGLDGGETVTITGVNLGAGDVTNVTLCGVSVSSIVSQSATQVVVVAAAGIPGLGDVRVYSVSFGVTVRVNAYDYQTRNLTVLGTNGTVVASGEAADPAKGTAFGYAPIGRATTNRLSLRSGWVDITISGVTTSGTGAAAFRVANPPATVPAGSDAPFDIVFDPDALGSYEASFTITSDATNSPQVVNVSGSACSVTPFSGPAAGGTTVTLTNGLIGGGDDITNVLIGATAASAILDQGTNWVTFVVPAGSAGSVDITIQSASIGNTIFSRCYRYNPPGAIANDVPTSWTEVKGLPGATRSHDCCTLNGRLYSVGGYQYSAKTNVYCYDGTNWTEVAGLPVARSDIGCETLNDRIYAMGGGGTNVYCFDGTNWTEVAGASAALNGPACAVLGGYLYAIAGNNNTNVYRFNGTNWTQIAGLPQPRYWLGAGVMNGALYAVGGYQNSTSVSSVYRFNGTSWTEVSSLPTTISRFGYEVLNDRIYIVNGYSWGGGDWRTNVYSYTEVESRHVAGLSSHYMLACGVLNGNLYAVGGESGSVMTNVWRFFPGWLGVTPARGSSAGGYTVTIAGSNLCDGADVTNVTLCGISVASVQSQSPTQIVVIAGAGGSGYGEVRVYSTGYGTTIKADAFAYDTPGIEVRGTNGALITSGEAADAAKGTAFGTVKVNGAVTNWLSVSNNGTAVMNISGWTTNGTGAAQFRISGLPTQLLSRASASFPVVFAPGAVGSFTASLEIENDTVTTPYIVNLTGSSFDLDVDNGPLAGGNTITITNGNFGTITNVLVGGVAATIQASGGSWVTITVPATGSAGVKDIVIQAEEGDTALQGAYTVNPQGQIGGTSVNLHGVVCRYEFTNTMADSLGNGLAMTSYNNSASGYTTSGLYWVASGSPGGGLTGYGPTNSAQGSNYTLRIQCSFSAVSSYRRLVRHQVSDYGLYVYSGQLYPLGAGERSGPTNAANVMMDLYITRDATSNVVRTWQVISNTVWYCGGDTDSSRYFVVQGYDTNRPLWRFFHDDGSEYTPSGVVRRIWMWDQPLTSNQISDIYSGSETPGVVPDNGSTVGGYEVVINGTDLGNGSDITNVTLCGVSVASIESQSATQVVVTAASAGAPVLGDVRVFSTSFGEAVASNAFEYTMAGEALLTIVSAYGTATPAVGVYTNPLDAVLTNAIGTPDTRGTTQYVCAGWAMVGNEPSSGSGTQVVMTVTNNATLTWLWTTNYWLETGAGAHGSVNVSEGWQAFGVTTQLTATADTYYHFAGWTGDISPSDISSNPVGLFMDGSKVVGADFAENLATNATPEWWLAGYGWTGDFDAAALDDQDEDRMPSWKEYVAGTVPTNAESVFIAESAPVLTFDREAIKTNQLGVVCTVNVYRVESLILGWRSATGRVYSVSCGSVLGSFDTVLAADLPATPNWNSYTCDVHGAVATALYYRVQVRLP